MTSGIRLTDWELLSAYLDDELSARERAALEARLAAEPALQAELDELRRTVQVLRATPLLTPPRSFVLDPAVYRRRPPWWLRYGAFRLVGLLGTAAALVLIGFGVLLTSQAPTRPALQSIAYQETQAVAGLLAQETASAVQLAPTGVPEDETEPSNAKPSAPPALALMSTATPTGLMARMTPTPLATATAWLERTGPPPSASPEGRDKGNETDRAATLSVPAPSTAVPMALGGMATTAIESPGSAADQATINSRRADETRTATAPELSGGGPGDGAAYAMTPTPAALTREQPAQQTSVAKSSGEVPPIALGTIVLPAPSVPTTTPTATTTAAPTATPTAVPTSAPLPSTTPRPTMTATSLPAPSATLLGDSASNAVSSHTATPSHTVTRGIIPITPLAPVSETPAPQVTDSLDPTARLLLVGGLALLIISLLVFGIAWARSRL
jgi:hypothetical protein